MNKRLFLLALLMCFTVCSCEYDDTELWGELNTIKTQLVRSNQEVDAVQQIIEAQQSGQKISAVKMLSEGYQVQFENGEALIVKTGDNATLVGVGLFEGSYYWTLGGKDEWLLDSDNNKVPVGSSSHLVVDDGGYWELNGKRLTDATGSEVKAIGGDSRSLFKSVVDDQDNHQVVFTLTNGTSINISKSTGLSFSFSLPEGDKEYYSFAFGETKMMAIALDNISSLDVMKAPKGWTIDFDRSANQAKITAPKPNDDEVYSKGIITLVGINKDGKTQFASISVCASIDFTDKDGTYVLCEGNMTSANGSLIFFDGKGKEYKEVFEKANGKLEIGNVFQDMYIANGRIYLLTQNGSNMNGAGRYVVCDAQTMKKVYASPLVMQTPKGDKVWPQHLVIVSKTKGYVQYAQQGMEATSGICEIMLKGDTAIVKNTVKGTFGAFTVEGATKTRMIYSKGKVYAGCGNSVIIIDPESNAITKRLSYPNRQIKGIVKGADGNIYFAVSASFTGAANRPTFTGDKAQIIGIDPEGNVLQQDNVPDAVSFPVATWTPAINMGASFKQPYLYFVDKSTWGASTLTRYNYSTRQFDVNYTDAKATVYGIVGVNPKTEELWVGTTKDYMSSDVKVFSTTDETMAKLLRTYTYSSDKFASTASIDFPYRFTSEYINK